MSSTGLHPDIKQGMANMDAFLSMAVPPSGLVTLDITAARKRHPRFVDLATHYVYARRRISGVIDLTDVGIWQYEADTAEEIEEIDELVLEFDAANDRRRREMLRELDAAIGDAGPLFEADLGELAGPVRSEAVRDAAPVFVAGLDASIAFARTESRRIERTLDRIRRDGRERGARHHRPRESRGGRRLTSHSAGGGSPGRPGSSDDDVGEEPAPPTGGAA